MKDRESKKRGRKNSVKKEKKKPKEKGTRDKQKQTDNRDILISYRQIKPDDTDSLRQIIGRDSDRVKWWKAPEIWIQLKVF